MMGVYGMLAVALALFAVRYLRPAAPLVRSASRR